MLLNWKLISHPLNWAIVVLMVVLGVFALNLILTPWHTPFSTTS